MKVIHSIQLVTTQQEVVTTEMQPGHPS